MTYPSIITILAALVLAWLFYAAYALAMSLR